tara:strand:+ start:1541 stop:2302 length:762 start_codon:yes stop_codon:yes gene_type:complete
MWFYDWRKDLKYLNPAGYFVNDGTISSGGFFTENSPEWMIKEAPFAYEIELIHKIANDYADPTKDFIDIGSHVGVYTIILGNAFNKTYAFEPNKEIYNFLCANIAIKENDFWKKVDTYNLGISNINGELPFIKRGNDGEANGFEEIKEYRESEVDGLLPVKTLDSFKFDNVGFIKIDVEGHEKSVIEGAINTIINNNYPPILFESWEPGKRSIYDDDFLIKNRKELFETIESLGYKIKKLLPNWNEQLIAIKE